MKHITTWKLELYSKTPKRKGVGYLLYMSNIHYIFYIGNEKMPIYFQSLKIKKMLHVDSTQYHYTLAPHKRVEGLESSQ